MKVDAVDTGICSFYATLYAEYCVPCIQALAPLQEGRPV